MTSDSMVPQSMGAGSEVAMVLLTINPPPPQPLLYIQLREINFDCCEDFKLYW